MQWVRVGNEAINLGLVWRAIRAEKGAPGKTSDGRDAPITRDGLALTSARGVTEYLWDDRAVAVWAAIVAACPGRPAPAADGLAEEVGRCADGLDAIVAYLLGGRPLAVSVAARAPDGDEPDYPGLAPAWVDSAGAGAPGRYAIAACPDRSQCDPELTVIADRAMAAALEEGRETLADLRALAGEVIQAARVAATHGADIAHPGLPIAEWAERLRSLEAILASWLPGPEPPARENPPAGDVS